MYIQRKVNGSQSSDSRILELLTFLESACWKFAVRVSSHTPVVQYVDGWKSFLHYYDLSGQCSVALVTAVLFLGEAVT